MALDAAFHRNDGTPDEPGRNSDWSEWVGASKTYNFCEDDPLIDWLELWGRARGFVPDHERAGYDGRTDFRSFLFARGNEFERAVCAYLAGRHQFVDIRSDTQRARDRAAVEATWEAMSHGVEIIAQGVLWNPENRTYGAVDLLVRSDVLHARFPDDITESDARVPAPHLPIGSAHYRVVDIKFTTLNLLKDGHAGSGHLKYMVQLWLYNEALGRLQGFTPSATFLLGRRSEIAKTRRPSALARLARIDHHHVMRDGTSLAQYALAACDWVRRVRTKGGDWHVLPEPAVPELWPNAKRAEDAPWHLAKREIAHALEDLTMLPQVTCDRRAAAIAAGLQRWTDPACCAASLGVTGEKHPVLLDAVLEANQSPPDGPLVFPSRVSANEALWREPARLEFYVDFETVSDLDDDFSRFPEPNGNPLIFMIGCGHLAGPPGAAVWEFRVFTAHALLPAEELRVIEDWLAHMEQVCAAHSTTLAETRLFHWSPAEVSTMLNAYNSAYMRHGQPAWPVLPWCDLLKNVVKEQPVTVRGAFGFGLKAIARAMHAHGLIETVWSDGPADGLGAMIGAWQCDREAKASGTVMPALPLMHAIESYNEVDCKVMAEVLAFLRKHR